MATVNGCIDLLTALSALDPRVRFDAATASGWAAVLHRVPDEILVQAGMDAARGNEYSGLVTVGMVEKAAESYLIKIARDVKSARMRKLVPDDWPDNRPIPAEARERLTREYYATNSPADQIAAGGKTPNLGQIGKDIP